MHTYISIHALLAESDHIVARAGNRAIGISIHALLAESDEENSTQKREAKTFLSTLSLRRATPEKSESLTTYLDFYPRSPCGERLVENRTRPSAGIFLSTLSLRRATIRKRQIIPIIQNFYPRSPCGERPGGQSCNSTLVHFYPRSPCGERPLVRDPLHAPHLFLSTLSLRRAT